MSKDQPEMVSPAGWLTIAALAITGCTADLPTDGVPPMSIACETARTYLSRCLDTPENDAILRRLNDDHRARSIDDSEFTQQYCAVCSAPWETLAASCQDAVGCKETVSIPGTASSKTNRRAKEAADYNYDKGNHYRVTLPFHIEIEF